MNAVLSDIRTARNEAAAAPATGVARTAVGPALNIEWPPEAEVPEWVQLLPGGERVEGRDGRWWTIPDARAVAEASELPMVLDWEHATDKRAPMGEPAPAAAWIEALDARADGSIWGRAAWTGNGKYSVANREYRFLSAAFDYLPDERQPRSGQMIRLVRVALTNRPNLLLAALNRADTDPPPPPAETAMNWEKVLAALGLPADATEAQALNAVERIKGDLQTARNHAESPPLDRYVPRPDYDQAVERATNAEHKLAEREKETREAEIQSELDAALEAKKITPATVEYHRAQCRAEGGLEHFKEYVQHAPEVVPDSNLGGKTPGEEGGEAGLTPGQITNCAPIGSRSQELEF